MHIHLATPRLVLRRFTATDAPLLFELDSDPEVMRFLNGGLPPDFAAIRDTYLPRFLANYDRSDDFGYWAAEELPAREFIGWFHFRPTLEKPDVIELGYRLMRKAWGRGLATEGSRALIADGFARLGVDRVEATTMAANVASRRVIEKLGMSLVEHYTEERFPGADKDAVRYRVMRQHPDAQSQG